jgi:hypothetical protein
LKRDRVSVGLVESARLNAKLALNIHCTFTVFAIFLHHFHTTNTSHSCHEQITSRYSINRRFQRRLIFINISAPCLPRPTSFCQRFVRSQINNQPTSNAHFDERSRGLNIANMVGRPRRASTSSVDTEDESQRSWKQEKSVLRFDPGGVDPDTTFEIKDAVVLNKDGHALENALDVATRGPYIIRGLLHIEEQSQRARRWFFHTMIMM